MVTKLAILKGLFIVYRYSFCIGYV